VTSWR
jgi:hypothetical protein